MRLIFSYSGKDFASPVPVLPSIHSRGVGRGISIEDWGKSCWVPQPSACPQLPVCQPCLSQEVHFPWPIVSGWHTCRNSCYSLHPLPSAAPAVPWLAWPHLYTPGQCSWTLPGISVPAFLVCVFHSCPLVWPAALESSVLVSCLLSLIFRTWCLKALVFYGKHS